MKKFKVTIPYACFVTVEVEAESKDDAAEIAVDEVYIMGYCGNGGTDKLIGVDGDASIEAGDTPLEFQPFSIEVQEQIQ